MRTTSNSRRAFYSPKLWCVPLILLAASAVGCVRGTLLGDAGARALSVVLGGYPKFTGRFAPLPGPHPVSFTRIALGDGGCEAQILYPAREGTGHRGRYARRELPSGLADFSNLPRFLYRPLSARRHPCPEDGDPAYGAGRRDGKTTAPPVVIFSHGLGGCAEMYTGLCASLASYGCVVVAIEHRDGSGCFARTADGTTVIPHKRYDGPPVANYTRDLAVKFRAPFLRQRVEETLDAIRHVMAAADEEGSGVLAGVDKTEVHLVGHSFGAATMTLVSQRLDEEEKDLVNGCTIGSVTLLDPWLTPLEERALEKGISHPQTHVLSKPWCKGPEFDAALRLGRATGSKGAAFYAAPMARHSSFSDAPNWFPGFLTRKFGVRGPEEELYVTHGAVAKLVSGAVRGGEGVGSGDDGRDSGGSAVTGSCAGMTPVETEMMKALELLELDDVRASDRAVVVK